MEAHTPHSLLQPNKQDNTARDTTGTMYHHCTLIFLQVIFRVSIEKVQEIQTRT
jgi:hypothetical protein